MVGNSDGMGSRQAAAALEWLAAMGADEIVGERPVDRFRAVPAPSSASSSRRKPRPIEPPKQVPAVPLRGELGPGLRRDDELGGKDAASLAAACQSLDEIAAALSRFDACPLKKTATRLVFCDGHPQAPVMFVGEAPGNEEDIQGKPFVGRSGQLLDRILGAIGLDRHAADPQASAFISNMIFWRPPGNRKPTEQEILQCLPFLKRLIELKRPRLLACLGATPTHALTGRTDGILKLRGRWFDHAAGDATIPLLATLHPAYLLRAPAQKRLVWRDMLSLRQRLDAA